jgi:homocysteine S-methyltransferase
MPEVLLMDGGVSTHLENMIAPDKFSHRDLWSSSLLLTDEGRASITKGHKDWLDSGSDLLTTVTYQCHYGLVEDAASKGAIENDLKATTGVTSKNSQDSSITSALPKEKMKEMMIDGVLLAKRAIDATNANSRIRNSVHISPSPTDYPSTLGPFVVASTGPYGAAMADGSEYTGKYPAHVTREALVDFHTLKARTLLMEGKPDGLAVETIPNIEEVGVVCEVLRDLQQQREELHPDLPPIACWISLACRNGSEMNDGHTVKDALRIVQSYDPYGRWIVGIGVNCFNSAYTSSLVTTIMKESLLQNNGRRGIIIYPNSGEGWDAVNEVWKDGSGASEVELADRLMEAIRLIRDICGSESGTKEEASSDSSIPSCAQKIILGGCCRTKPATIAMLRKRVDTFHGIKHDFVTLGSDVIEHQSLGK